MVTSPAPRTAEALVQRFVKQLTNGHPHPSSVDKNAAVDKNADDSPRVLLDLEVDGIRCLLVRSQPRTAADRVVLSPREQEIARMVAKGHPNKTIAAVLEISPWTVSTHLRRLFAKLGVRSRAAMVALLVEKRLLWDQPDEPNRSAPRRARPLT
jgi:DNA-binding CsgD family transcriptional regulator